MAIRVSASSYFLKLNRSKSMPSITPQSKMYSLRVLGGLASCCGIDEAATATMAITTRERAAVTLENSFDVFIARSLALSGPHHTRPGRHPGCILRAGLALTQKAELYRRT